MIINSKRLTPESGSILLISSGIIVLMIAFGMLILKLESNFSTRVTLSLTAISAVNAASNASPEPSDMFEAGCNALSMILKIPVDECRSANFPPVNQTPIAKIMPELKSEDASFFCKSVSFQFNPGRISDQEIKPKEFCIELVECQEQGSWIVPLITNEPYKFGASACANLKPPAVMMAVDMSQKLHEIYEGYMMPPTPLMDPNFDPDSPLSLADGEKMRSNSLPGVYESYTDAPALFAAEPALPYQFPFSTKEVSTIQGVPNQYSSNPNSIPDFLKRSMPEVVPQTTLINPEEASPTEPDPIQYLPLLGVGNSQNANDPILRWAGRDPNLLNNNEPVPDRRKDFRWRHGVLTSHELSHRCFGPRKLWHQRMAQQVMYMLDHNNIPFGTLAYSNWIYGLMPYIPYHHRLAVGFPSSAPLKTLNLPLMGPSPDSMTSVLGENPQYVEKQFGNYEDSELGGLLDRETNYSLIVQPMSLCSREMKHEVLPNAPLHLFTALPNPYDREMRVTSDSTQCTNNGVPTLDNVKTSIDGKGMSFIFRAQSPNSNHIDTPTLPWGQDAKFIFSGDCFGDLSYDNSGNQSQPLNYLADDLGAGNLDVGICGNNAADYLPNWMRRDRADAEKLSNGKLNIDDVSPEDVTHPYRFCPDTSSPAVLENTLAGINTSVALSSLRSGGFTKSGWPLNIPQTSVLDTHTGNPAPSARKRYFTGPNDWNNDLAARSVYPVHEPVVDAFTSGALFNMHSILKNTSLIPDQKQVRPIALLFSDGVATVSMQDALEGNHDSAWFPQPPTAAQLPTGVAGDPAGPFSLAMNESLQVIHEMAAQGITVIVVSLEDNDNDTPIIKNTRKVFSWGLRRTLGTRQNAADSSTFKYALCKPCGNVSDWETGPNMILPPICTQGWPGVNEPAITEPRPASCFNELPAKNIHEIRIRKGSNESWTEYQNRMFEKVTISINRIINGYTLSK
jgi:hypothetical protein